MRPALLSTPPPSSYADNVHHLNATDGIPEGVPYTGCAFTAPASAIIFIAYVLVVFSETSAYPFCYHLFALSLYVA